MFKCRGCDKLLSSNAQQGYRLSDRRVLWSARDGPGTYTDDPMDNDLQGCRCTLLHLLCSKCDRVVGYKVTNACTACRGDPRAYADRMFIFYSSQSQ
jgi:hypothetical protein